MAVDRRRRKRASPRKRATPRAAPGPSRKRTTGKSTKKAVVRRSQKTAAPKTARKKAGAQARGATRTSRQKTQKTVSRSRQRTGIEPRKAKTQSQVYRLFEEAVSLLHHKKYRDARDLFVRITQSFPEEIEVLDRVNAFLKICDAHLRRRRESPPSTGEEFFDRGVMHHNIGEYEEALECFSNALKMTRRNSHDIHYAMAATEVHLGNYQKALKSLKRAIELKEEHRFHARNDPDFEPLTHEEKFQQLVRAPLEG